MGIYKREGASRGEAWNVLIRDVNEILENPPDNTDCEPLPPIDEVEPQHIWTVGDIEEVQNALKETCPNIDFPNELKFWKQEIINDIEDAMDQAWCDCVEPSEPTYYDLGVWSPTPLMARRGSASETIVVVCGTLVTTYGGEWYPDIDNDAAWVAIREQRSIINEQQTIYIDAVEAVWVLEDEIKVLENEIESLEGQIERLTEDRDAACAADPEGQACSDLTAEIIVKEAELAEKEAELAEKEVEEAAKITVRQAARDAWNTAAQTEWALLKSLAQRYPTDINPVGDLFPDMSEPWGDYLEDKRNWDRGEWVYYYAYPGSRQYKKTGQFSPDGYPCITGSIPSKVYFIEITCKQTTTTLTCPYCDCFAWIINRTHCCCEGPFCQEPITPNCCEGIECDQTWDWVFGVPQVIWSSCIPSNDYYKNCNHMITWTLSFKVEHSPNYTRP